MYAATRTGMNIREALYLFISTYASDEKLEPRTVDKYRRTAIRLQGYLEATTGSSRVFKLSEAVIRGYMGHYQNLCDPTSCPIPYRGKDHIKKKIGTTTHDAELALVKVFCTWLYEGDYVARDYAKSMKFYGDNSHVNETQILYPDQLTPLVDVAMKFYPVMGYQIKFLWHSGVRISSAQSMKVGDYRPDRADAKNKYGIYYYVNEKVKNQKTSKPIDPDMAEWMAEYLEWYKTECVKFGYLTPWQEIPSDWYLFPTWISIGRKTRGISCEKKINPFEMKANPSQCISQLMKDTAAVTGNKDFYIRGNAAHAIRRGAGTEIYLVGGLEAARIFLDHQDQKTTLKYLRLDVLKDVEREAIFKRFERVPVTEGAKVDDTPDTPNNVLQFAPRQRAR